MQKTRLVVSAIGVFVGNNAAVLREIDADDGRFYAGTKKAMLYAWTADDP